MSIRASATADTAEPGWCGGAWRRFRRNHGALVGVAALALLALLAVFADKAAPFSPYDADPALRGAGPSGEHLLGMDQIGRDVLSRLIYGTRTALLVGVVATGVGMTLGVGVGAIAGYAAGTVDALLMRVVDALGAFPSLILLIAISTAVGPGLATAIAIIGLTTWGPCARVVRAQVQSLRQEDFVVAARCVGASDARIIVRHLLPHVLGTLIVLASLSVAGVILLNSALSFLGLGPQPPTPDWGSMLGQGRDYLTSYPHIALAPGVAVAATALAFNLVAEGLRDALDPWGRGSVG